MRSGPWISRALVVNAATWAPARSSFNSSAPSCTPVVAANEHVMNSRRMPIQCSGQRDSADVDSCSRGVTSSVSRSMSGWYSRLNSARPSTPVACRASAEMAERREPRAELDRERHLDLGAHLLRRARCIPSPRRPELRSGSTITSYTFFFQFDGVGSGALEAAGVLHPSRSRAVRLGDHGNRRRSSAAPTRPDPRWRSGPTS